MPASIFRQEALERLGSPEQLDQLMPLTNMRGWIALAGAGALLVLVFLWGVFGTIETRVEGYAVLTRPGGLKVVEAPEAGAAASIRVTIGSDVRPGEELLRLAPSRPGVSATVQIVAPEAARVLDLAVREGETVAKGTALVTLEFPDRPLNAVVYVAASDGEAVRPGTEVQFRSLAARAATTPFLRGRVKSTARLPATRAALLRTLQSEDQVNSLLRAGPCLEVVVELTPHPGPGGAGGAAPELYSGMTCLALVTVDARRPISLVFPAVRHLLGS